MAVTRKVILTNENRQPLAGVVVEAFKRSSNQPIMTVTTDKAGLALFLLSVTGDDYWFRPRITRTAGKMAELSTRGRVNMWVEPLPGADAHAGTETPRLLTAQERFLPTSNTGGVAILDVCPNWVNTDNDLSEEEAASVTELAWGWDATTPALGTYPNWLLRVSYALNDPSTVAIPQITNPSWTEVTSVEDVWPPNGAGFLAQFDYTNALAYSDGVINDVIQYDITLNKGFIHVHHTAESDTDPPVLFGTPYLESTTVHAIPIPDGYDSFVSILSDTDISAVIPVEATEVVIYDDTANGFYRIDFMINRAFDVDEDHLMEITVGGEGGTIFAVVLACANAT